MASKHPVNTDAAGIELGLRDDAEDRWRLACTVMAAAQAIGLELVLDGEGSRSAWVAEAQDACSLLYESCTDLAR